MTYIHFYWVIYYAKNHVKSFVAPFNLDHTSGNCSHRLEESDDQLTFVDTQTGVEWMTLSGYESESLVGGNGAGSIESIKNSSLFTSGWRFPKLDELMVLVENVVVGEAAKSRMLHSLSLSPSATTSRQILGDSRGKYGAEYDFMDLANLFGTRTYGTTGLQSSYNYYDGEGVVALNMYMSVNSITYEKSYQQIIRYYTESDLYTYGFGPFLLVSDGNATLTSSSQPELYINNINAPINQMSDVPITFALGGLMMAGMFFRQRR